MLGAKVDFVLSAVQPEADGSPSLAAIDEQSLYLLRNDYPITRTALVRKRRNINHIDAAMPIVLSRIGTALTAAVPA
jgi:hypothetical protein